MLDGLLLWMVAPAVSFAAVYLSVPGLIRYLERRRWTVPDVLKKGRPGVARPGGPAILAGILSGGAILYWFYPDAHMLGVMGTASCAFVVGLVDDWKVMGGWFKPIALAFCAFPILVLGVYDTDLVFPLFGEVHIPLLYIGLIVIMIPIMGNAVNSIDVMNGVASGFMVIAGSALSVSLVIVQRYEMAMMCLVLVLASLAFYKYHRYPSRIFPGDSGALVLGGAYGAIAITGGLEVVAAIAVLPAIISSFLFLSSVKRIVEHRQLQSRPVIITDDMKIKDSGDPTSRISLVRMIVSKGPLTEKDVARQILKLSVFSGALAIFTAFLMEVRI